MKIKVVAYQYNSSCGCPILKAVICKTEEKYNELVRRIEDAGYELIEFDEVWNAEEI